MDQLGNRTTFVYDAAGNRTLYKDALNNRTTFVYDGLDREIEQVDPHGQSTTFAYDSAGFLTSTTNRLALRRDFSYDDVGRKTGEVWIDTDGSTVVDRITFTYDAVGNQLTAANGAGAYTFTYDDVNRVSTVAEPFGVSLTFTWDALARRTKVEDSFGGVTTSVYNVLGRLEGRRFGGTSQTPLRIDLTYTVEGLQESFTRYSDLSGTTKVATTSFTYDAAQRLSNLHHFDGSNNNIGNYTYTYDGHSRLTNETRNGTPVTYTYDNTDQVTGDGTATFTYDAEGNRTNEGYSTGTGNQLTSDGTWTYSYDDEGNQTKKSKGANDETWTYGYDQRNQLTWVEKRATDGGTLQKKAQFKYDAFGNRIEKTVDSDGDGDTDITQRYALDGWNSAKSSPIGNENWDVFADLDGNNDLETRYLRADVVDQVFARIAANGDAFWYFGDHLGSIRDITNNTGVVKDTLSYDAFGNIISETDAQYRGRYAWTARELDTEIDLQYNRARYYDAKTGRWLSQDPLGFEAGDSNLYRYINNNPTNFVDPTGAIEFTFYDTDKQISYVTMKLKISFVFINSRGENWSLERKERFNHQFKIVVEGIWNHRNYWWNGNVYIIGKDCYHFKNGFSNRLWIPTLEIEIVGPNDIADYKMEIYASGKRDLTREGAVRRIKDRLPEPGLGIINGYLTENSVGRGGQVAAHEVGHLLGLSHPGQDLPLNKRPPLNSPEDYNADSAALMGNGYYLRAHYFSRCETALNKRAPSAGPFKAVIGYKQSALLETHVYPSRNGYPFYCSCK